MVGRTTAVYSRRDLWKHGPHVVIWNYTLPIGLLTSIVLINVEALIPNWIVT